MRFSRHLSSHLTPEWRKQYIQYTELKKLVYDMVGSKKNILGTRPHNREELYEEEGVVEVDTTLQEEFFDKVDSQIQSITQFFKKEESGLQFSLSELEDQVSQLGTLTVRKAGKQRQVLKRAFSEIYLNLVLLQNFQQLNHTGFRKILKKHDKLARTSHGKRVFADDVCKAYFWTSKSVTDMIVKVEKAVIQLEDGNRTKAMNKLRVPPLGSEHKRSHWVSFCAGLFCGLVLLSVVVLSVAFALWPEGCCTDSPHFEPSVRAMRAGLLVSIWFFGFALNTFGWRRAGVNNVLIFEYNPRNYLNFVDLFAVAGMVSFIWIAGMYLFIFSPWLSIPVYVAPLAMYGVMVSMLFLPLPIMKAHSRLWLLKTLGRIICAPFFRVTFADFWLADQLTSLILPMLDTEYFFCHLFYGHSASDDALFSCGTGSYGLRVIVGVLPAWWRFAQCLRRYRDTKEANPHLINAGKYSTAFFVVVFSATASTVINDKLPLLDQNVLYLMVFGLWVLSAVVSTSYTFSWDILMDWSLFPNIPQRCCHKKALMLREDRIYAYKLYYVLALVEDFLFRILWIFNLSVGHHVLGLVNDDIIATVAGVLEVARRCVWNFFRVENEHVNNVGQFRAVRDIALYPVDLSHQTEQEENEEFSLESRNSLERRSSLKRLGAVGKKRPLKRKLSHTLVEVSDAKPISSPKIRKASTRSSEPPLSATLYPALLQEGLEALFTMHLHSDPNELRDPQDNTHADQKSLTHHDGPAGGDSGNRPMVDTAVCLDDTNWDNTAAPLDSSNSTRDDTAAPLDCSSSTRDNTAAPLDSSSSTRDNIAAPLDSGSSTQDDTAAHLDGSNSTRDNTAAPLDSGSSARDNTAAHLDGSNSTRDDTAAPLDSGSSARDNTAAHLDGSNSTRDDTAAPLDSSSSTRDDGAAPLDSRSSTRDDGAAPLDCSSSTRDDGAAPLDSRSSTRDDGAAPLDCSSSTRDDGAAPLDSSSSTRDDGAAALDTNYPPRDDTAMPLDSSRPTQDVTTTPADSSRPIWDAPLASSSHSSSHDSTIIYI